MSISITPGTFAAALRDQVDNFAPRRRVHDFVKRGAQQTHAIRGNNGAGKKRGPIVRALPSFASDERDRNTDKRGGRSKSIAAVMPGIRLHRRTFDITPDAVDVANKISFTNMTTMRIASVNGAGPWCGVRISRTL